MRLNSKVAQKVEITPELMILRVVPEGWELPDFKPGQFAVLGLPGTAPRTKYSDPEEPLTKPDKLIKRAYSIASSSENKEFIEFYVALVRSGSLTPRIFELNPGDEIFLGPKFTGMFTLDMVEQSKNLILLSTGTGLAPYMSMIRTVLEPNMERQIVIAHGARHSWDLGYRSELMTLRSIFNNLHYIPVISRPKGELTKWNGEIGYIQDIWNHKEQHFPFSVTDQNTHIFLCGNPAMIDDMLVILTEQGFKEHSTKSPGNIHFERYW